MIQQLTYSSDRVSQNQYSTIMNYKYNVADAGCRMPAIPEKWASDLRVPPFVIYRTSSPLFRFARRSTISLSHSTLTKKFNCNTTTVYHDTSSYSFGLRPRFTTPITYYSDSCSWPLLSTPIDEHVQSWRWVRKRRHDDGGRGPKYI